MDDETRRDETHAACYVWHRTDHRCAGMNPEGELRNGDAGKDADEQLAGQSLFNPTLVEDRTCTLWFATVGVCCWSIVSWKKIKYSSERVACVPQQDDVGLLHRSSIFPDGDLDGIPSERRMKFLAQAPSAFFTLYAGDEA